MSAAVRIIGPKFAMTPEELLYDPSVSPEAKTVYAILHRHGSDPESCYPKHRTIAEKMGKSERSVGPWITSLEEAGWVRKIPRWENVQTGLIVMGSCPSEGKWRQTSNGYELFMVCTPPAGERTPPSLESATKENQLNEITTQAPPEPSSSGQDDDFPVKSEDGLSYAKTVARWLRGRGVTLPPANRKDEAYAAVVRHVDAFLPDGDRRRTGCTLGIISDFLADVADEELPREARSHIARLIGTHGPVAVLYAFVEGVQWGAGLDEEHADARALSKYATAVLTKKARAA